MSFGFLGIQFGFALQNANVSRIFESLGASVEDIPILWIAAPVTGLIVQPIIGHMSDRTWGKLGRRRPYFLVGAILASASLLIMPNSTALWMAAGMLWIMDASINISMEPFRAFVGDNLPDEQRTTGFAMQSFFIGIGAYVASSLPYVMTNWFEIPNTPDPGEMIPPSVKFSFYIGGTVFLLAVLYTVLRSKEYSPQELALFNENEAGSKHSDRSESLNPSSRFLRLAVIWSLAGLLFVLAIWLSGLKSELYILGFGLLGYGVLQGLTGWFVKQGRTSGGLVMVINDLYNMPGTMKQLAVVQFFSWFALFAMWIYSTSAVTSHIYGTSDAQSELYNTGADWVGVLFGYYNLFAAGFAFLLPVMARFTSRKITHSFSLIMGGIGLASFYFIREPEWLIFPMIGVGIAWASILAMPYAILTGALPASRMGTYMGIFNFFIVIPQILAASMLGFLVNVVFHNEAIYALLLGGGSMVLAALLMFFVSDVTYRSK
jgi:maltose/moltooligosaccharide transporter